MQMQNKNIEEKEEEKEEKKQNPGKWKLTMALAIIALSLTLFNQVQLIAIKSGEWGGGLATGLAVASASVMPSGTPKIYGKELGINYNDVDASNPQLADQTIRTIANLDTSLTLTGSDLERYVKIVSQISCEYCCGAKSIIFDNGKPACGCAHSYAMRGLAKHLIKNHGNEFSDDEILTELAKWKTLFFPDIMQGKVQVLRQKGIEVNYINLGSNKYRGIEKGASSGSNMVGGC